MQASNTRSSHSGLSSTLYLGLYYETRISVFSIAQLGKRSLLGCFEHHRKSLAQTQAEVKSFWPRWQRRRRTNSRKLKKSWNGRKVANFVLGMDSKRLQSREEQFKRNKFRVQISSFSMTEEIQGRRALKKLSKGLRISLCWWRFKLVWVWFYCSTSWFGSMSAVSESEKWHCTLIKSIKNNS